MSENLEKNKVRVICHLADIHIRTYRMHEEYMSVFKKLMSDLTDLLVDYKREEIRIVIAGDLVHQKIVISNEQLMLGTWFLSKLENIAPVIVIAGNHDLLENNKDRMDSISPMVQFLFDKNVNYFKESKCYLDNNIVWCVYSIFEENSRPDIEAARLEFGDDKTYIGLYHAPIINAKTDIGYEIDHGSELEIFEGCDMVMLGDIHKRQSFNYKGIPIAYPSSLIQQNFGENVSKHGFLLWDVETKTFTEHDVENKSPFYQFKIKSLEDLDNGTEVLTNK
jgi:DNA repair exonuclease SbcCD nuclease subunit